MRAELAAAEPDNQPQNLGQQLGYPTFGSKARGLREHVAGAAHMALMIKAEHALAVAGIRRGAVIGFRDSIARMIGLGDLVIVGFLESRDGNT